MRLMTNKPTELRTTVRRMDVLFRSVPTHFNTKAITSENIYHWLHEVYSATFF